MKLFRYIGSKCRLVNKYYKPPIHTKRIVEVFAGSMYLIYLDRIQKRIWCKTLQ